MSLKQFLLLLLLLLCSPTIVFGQFFSFFPQNRPAGLDWQQIKTDHFRIIFPNGEDSLAFRAAAILEDQYPAASKLTGGSLENFPVVLKNYNDLSNGFVTSLNFRSELDLAPIKGKDMNPKSGGWLENVLPHELVHATHFNVQQDKSEQKFSIPNIISYFSPDLARSFHGFVPVGLHEGLAVYHETENVMPDAGRGNFTYFTNRFNANFGSSNRWNMGQTFITPDYSLPNNRHYIAGASFIDWLQENYGESIFKETIRFHYHNFMFGYGYALKRKTGKWPGQLFALYEQDMQERENERLESIKTNTTERSRIIELPFKGEQARGPRWIDQHNLLFYGSFYNARLGFYKYNLENGELDLINESFAVNDFNYEIDEHQNLIYSNYSRHPLYSDVYRTDIRTLNVQTGAENTIAENLRIHTPTTGAGRIFGVQNDGSVGRIVEIFEDSIQVVKEFTDTHPVHLEINPANPDQIAVVLNSRGTQALWITTLNSLADNLEEQPDIAFKKASIHDPEWHPDGDKILFSMDAHPAMNIYEFDLQSQEIIQLTSSLYNAFEASYSSDGDIIAYVIQKNDERKLAILNRDDFVNTVISDDQLLTGSALSESLNKPLIAEEKDPTQKWEIEEYKTDWAWLKPRMILPVFRDNAGTLQSGVGISSIDVLQSQSYNVELTGIQNRLWYDISYTNKSFYPGITLNVYSDPVFFAANDNQTQEQFGVMRQDRGISLSTPIDYTFRGDTRLTSIHFEPEISVEQFKFFDLSPNSISNFATRYKAGIFSQFNYKMMSLPRDVQPSAGLSVFGLLEKTLNDASIDVDFPDSSPNEPEQIDFSNQWSAYYGAFMFLSPLRRWNQSLRLDIRFLQQSESPIYSNSTIIPMGFKFNPFPIAINNTYFNNIGRLSTRYTIPLFYPDTGGLTVPLYLSSIYLTGFSHTLTNLNNSNLLASSRSIFGAGFHVQFKLSNLLFDFGVGIAYEPSRNNTQFIFGEF